MEEWGAVEALEGRLEAGLLKVSLADPEQGPSPQSRTVTPRQVAPAHATLTPASAHQPGAN